VNIAIGAFLNALGILSGAIVGLVLRRPLTMKTQVRFRTVLGVATLFVGLRLVWLSFSGSFLHGVKQILVALLAVVLGNLVGKILRLQKLSNRAGRTAADLIGAAQRGAPSAADGFNACTILFCAAPLGVLGAVTDGLAGYWWLLAVKAVMDALAMVSFVKIFRWPAAMSAFSVFLLLGTITFLCQFHAGPFLAAHGLVHSVQMAAGLVCCAVAMVVFETRRVELANYLPALATAPLLAWLCGA